jgi:IS1 family transposase
MRMQIRRLTRLTNAFSKNFESHQAAIALHFAYYNFCKLHQTLRVTPAMEAGVTDRLWEVSELVSLKPKNAGQKERREQRYSPGEVVEAVPVVISGNPNKYRICTSHIERQNLTMRMQIRRLTRLTNAFSKKFESHKAAIALHFAYYNFCKLHQTLRVTPAMEAGITDHVWTLAELITA